MHSPLVHLMKHNVISLTFSLALPFHLNFWKIIFFELETEMELITY